MAKQKPVPTSLSPGSGGHRPTIPTPPYSSPRPKPSATSGVPKKWTFSFRFWRQIDYFGLGEQEPKWFVSVLEKLAELSKESPELFRKDRQKQDAWRYHDINWMQTNIPIQRNDLNWIDPDYRDNAEEFPLYQFQVSRALGRVVGFWDENDTFNVVLLDPLHNIQPSKRFDYRVDKTTNLDCVYTSLLFKLREVQKHQCTGEGCPLPTALKALPGESPPRRVLILQIDDEPYQDVLAAIELGSAESLTNIINAGIDSLLAAKSRISDQS